MQPISVAQLTREAFAAFGDVIETSGAENFNINNGTTTRYHDLARVETLGDDANALISIFRSDQRRFPLEIAMMERHPLGSQAFIPLEQRPFLIVVAPDESGMPGKPRAFLAAGNQGVNYATNVWHHPLLALDAASDFLVVDRGGKGNNLEEYFYPETFTIRQI